MTTITTILTTILEWLYGIFNVSTPLEKATLWMILGEMLILFIALIISIRYYIKVRSYSK